MASCLCSSPSHSKGVSPLQHRDASDRRDQSIDVYLINSHHALGISRASACEYRDVYLAPVDDLAQRARGAVTAFPEEGHAGEDEDVGAAAGADGAKLNVADARPWVFYSPFSLSRSSSSSGFSFSGPCLLT